MIETRPSAAHRWTRCSAAPLFAHLARQAGRQPADTDAAREGTCAAWLAEQVLTGVIATAWIGEGLIHPNGWPVDAEMMYHVQNYCDMITAAGGVTSAERKVWLSERVSGTLDNCATMRDGQIVVRDLKYGKLLVETDTEQLVIYAGALLREYPDATAVRTEIYQPRGFHRDGIHRGRDWTPDEIRDRCAWIIERAEMCHAPDPVATPGTHCSYCEAVTGCEALSSTVLHIVESVGYRDRTPSELGQALHMHREALAIVKIAAGAIESEADARIDRGEHIPGWGYTERLGQTKVTTPPDVITALTGVQAVKSVPLGVTELRKAGLSEKQVAAFTTRPVIGRKLEPLDAATLARQFKGV